jgi:aspartyl/asparaginyl beta-hydroxylase (cupin superfamily)
MSTPDIPGLWRIKAHYESIHREFMEVSPTLKRHFFHDLDTWFDKNNGYYFYKAEDFPVLKSLIDQVPAIHKETAVFAVVEGPMVIPPHRAESNWLLRYHLTIEGGGDCTLFTTRGAHVHEEGEEFLFDHARYHELVKTGKGRRVVLILDVYRCL